MNEQDARLAVHAAIGKVRPDVGSCGLDEQSRLRQDLELDSLDFLRLVETIETVHRRRYSRARLHRCGHGKEPDRLSGRPRLTAAGEAGACSGRGPKAIRRGMSSCHRKVPGHERRPEGTPDLRTGEQRNEH